MATSRQRERASLTADGASSGPPTMANNGSGAAAPISLATDRPSSESGMEIEIPALPTETLLEMYRMSLRIRRMEEVLLAAAEKGEIGGAMHTAIGHEANAVGAAHALRPGDYITCTYRGHHHGLAWGIEPVEAIAEVMGRSGGFAKGKGGSMHFVSPEHGLMGSNGIVAAQVPHGAGLALASWLRGEERVAITFFGDGAIYQGRHARDLQYRGEMEAAADLLLRKQPLFGDDADLADLLRRTTLPLSPPAMAWSRCRSTATTLRPFMPP